MVRPAYATLGDNPLQLLQDALQPDQEAAAAAAATAAAPVPQNVLNGAATTRATAQQTSPPNEQALPQKRERNVRAKRVAFPVGRESSLARSRGLRAKPHSRRGRRWEARMYLRNLVSEEELMVPPTVPDTWTWLRALQDPAAMRVWEMFAALSAAEQQAFLAPVKRAMQAELQAARDPQPRSPQDAFGGIARNIRTMLKKSRIPRDTVAAVEEQIVEVFLQDGKAQLQLILESSFERLLAHAVAQYYNLASESVTDGELRCTFVTNTARDGSFIRPTMALCDFLASFHE